MVTPRRFGEHVCPDGTYGLWVGQHDSKTEHAIIVFYPFLYPDECMQAYMVFHYFASRPSTLRNKEGHGICVHAVDKPNPHLGRRRSH
jgi:hypothetical protein